jgi:hypothetical protein
MIDRESVTTQKTVSTYLATNNTFLGLLKEIRELSKKNPDAFLSAGKVKIVNRVLEDLKQILDAEPEGKFLDLMDDSDLPQTSGVVIIMCQYETALKAYKNKYFQSYKTGRNTSKQAWVTPEFLEEYEDY